MTQTPPPSRFPLLLQAVGTNLGQFRDFAIREGLGLEIMTFGFASALDDQPQRTLDEHEAILAGFTGLRSMHGVFHDLQVATIDAGLREFTFRRYAQAYRVAQQFRAQYLVFHPNYNALLDFEGYDELWVGLQIDFWRRFMDEVATGEVTIVLENLWENRPELIGQVIDSVSHLRLAACLDVGHAHAYGQGSVIDWIRALGDRIRYIHLHDNNGDKDAHLSAGDGTIDWPVVMGALQALPTPPPIVLEHQMLDRAERTLGFLRSHGLV